MPRQQFGGDLGADLIAAPHAEDRLSIGLVLGGGAARGFAHIGVIRALAARHPRQQQVRHVRAGDEQHEADGTA